MHLILHTTVNIPAFTHAYKQNSCLTPTISILYCLLRKVIQASLDSERQNQVWNVHVQYLNLWSPSCAHKTPLLLQQL